MNTPDRNSKPATIKTILVLDDDVLVRMPVVQFLRDCGHRVVEAASTDEAMAIFQKTNFPVDVVLSEIDIPGSMNGFGFAQWARSVRPELKVHKRNTDERLKEEFDRWYPVYPRRSARRAAFKSYKQARSRGATPETLLHGAKRYAAQRAGQDPQFTKMPATWLNGDCWLDEPEIQLADIPAAPSRNAEGLSMPKRMAAAAKRARAQ